MHASPARTVTIAAAILATLGALYWILSPQAVQVDLATASRGQMEVTIEEEARTRVRHVYTVYAPISGRVLRISEPTGQSPHTLHVGDTVTVNETIVAIMQPLSPSFLDVRTQEELQAAVTGSDAAVTLAEAEAARIQASLNFARSELQRAQSLTTGETISVKALEKAKLDVATNEAALDSMKAQLQIRKSERDLARARLLSPAGLSDNAARAGCCVEIKAPVTGKVLRILQDSEGPVTAGTPLLELGDPLDLEIVAEFLSTDAIKLKPEAPVRISGWGGGTVAGKVTRIDPAGFVKISALGLEEQRVRVVVDFTDPPEAWGRLGHEYRVVVNAVAWSSTDVLKIPVTALYRKGEDWAVFRKSGRVAHATIVTIGQRNGREAQVLSGLDEGEEVILHPSDRVRNGVKIAPREPSI
jgi:HlyD family secretion protein